MNTSTPNWQYLSMPSEKLSAARLEIQIASQLVAAVSATYLPAHPDMSHTALQIDSNGNILGQVIKPNKTFRVVLNLHNMNIELQGHTQKGFELFSHFSLAGHTLSAAYDELDQAIHNYIGENAKKILHPHELPWSKPSHPISNGAMFRASNENALELCHWFANAENMLQEIHALHPMNASHLSLWPKHFDMFFSFVRPIYSVAIGFSAGDAVLKEPYFYIKPAPTLPEPLPVLSYGEWINGNWNGAILKASEIFSAGNNAEDQRNLVWKFLYSSLGVLNWIV
jgi:hypothetical protein